MQDDGFLVTRQPQPLHMLNWTGAAKRFVQTRDQFLKIDNPKLKNIIGTWSVVCFPFKGYTNRILGDLNSHDLGNLRSLIMGFKHVQGGNESFTVSKVEDLFKQHLEYPPYSLKDDWDRQAMRRRNWAETLFKNKILVIS